MLGAPDPRALAAFYERLLGWTVVANEGPMPGAPPEDAWVALRPPSGGTGLSFQYEPDFRPPVWPAALGEQRMLIHLDIAVEDLDAGVAAAVDAGATLSDHQPQQDVRVMVDPAGHHFCLFPGAL